MLGGGSLSYLKKDRIRPGSTTEANGVIIQTSQLLKKVSIHINERVMDGQSAIRDSLIIVSS